MVDRSTPQVRARNPRGHGDRLRTNIVDAASRLLGALGNDDALSMRAVAREVGVTPPAVYAHFMDKNALVLAVLDARFDDLRHVSDAAELAAGLDPRNRLLARAHAYVSWGLRNPGHYRVLFEGRASTLMTGQYDASGSADILRALTQSFEACSPDQPGAADERSLELWSALHGLVSLRLNKPGISWSNADRAVRRAVDLALLAEL